MFSTLSFVIHLHGQISWVRKERISFKVVSASYLDVLTVFWKIVSFVSLILLYVGCSEEYLTWFFSAETNEAREVCCGREVEGTFMRIRGFYSRQQRASVACSQRVCESVHAARVASFSTKMTERLEQRYCIKFCQKLGDSQVETIRKIQRGFGDDTMGITQIRER